MWKRVGLVENRDGGFTLMVSDWTNEEVTLRQLETADQGYHVVEISVNRPKALNALNANVLKTLSFALDHQAVREARVVILRGSGERAFVAGADIAELATLTAQQALQVSHLGQQVMNKIANLDQPTIAAVHGFALGGGLELAMSCDFILASDQAKFGLPEVNLGLLPGFGGTVRLRKFVGDSVAKRMMFSAEVLSAQQALQFGLVTEIIKHEQFFVRTYAFAHQVANKAPLAVKAIKRLLTSNDQQLLLKEQQAFAQLFSTEDMQSGCQAFLSKQKPSFKGR